MWEEDDYYDYSEFNMQIEQFKESIRNSVKEEITETIENLKAELATYKDLKENWEAKNKELDDKIREYETAKWQLEQDIRKELKQQTLVDLMGETYNAWGIDYTTECLIPKCDKCDDKRKIHFKSPSGKDLTEDCSCNIQGRVYFVVPAELKKVVSHKYEGRPSSNYNEILYSYKAIKKTCYYDKEVEQTLNRITMSTLDTIFDRDWSYDLWDSGIVFATKEEAEEFCRIVNEQEKEKQLKRTIKKKAIDVS